MNIKPQKGKLIYAMLTKQDGLIQLPETAKNRSTSSVVMAVNDTNSGLHANDVILHNMRYNGREEQGMKNSFYLNGELCKVMDISDVFAKVVGGSIVPINKWLFCKMIVPESVIAGAYNASDCNMVQLAACSVSADPKVPLRIGGKYLISGWSQEMQQFSFGNDHYIFLLESHLVAESVEAAALN